ncbi:type II toxin-antitoxin system PemK/MazF family toxin [Streptosporangium longisporum]|uniref:PemK-like, MazF-like toxin of type II toxin-antitoxin system n=1 Tax=Streptosporangium longisporum TaxID=46187 RepID=A0ABN3XUE2_9ACTN
MLDVLGEAGDLLILGLLIAGIYVFFRVIRQLLAPRPQPEVHEAPPHPDWNSRPRPGDIWWAGVPFADGSGGKVRPCLVIRTHANGVEVLKITSQDKSHRMNCVSIPTAHWDRRAQKDSWLDLDAPYLVNDHDFRRRAGACDDRTWSLVRKHHRTGWVYSPDH